MVSKRKFLGVAVSKTAKFTAYAAAIFVGLTACSTMGEVASSLKPSTQQKKAMQASQYPEFTKAFMAKMPELESGFFSSSEAKFSDNGDAMIYKVDELKRNNITNDWGRKGHAELYQKALSDYLNSGVAETNKQYQAFVKTCTELGLSVKKYRNALLTGSRLSLPYYNQGNYDSINKTSRKYLRDLDYIYLAFDKGGQIKVVFTYEHEFFFGNNGIIHDSMWALIWYGSAAMRAQQAFDNDWLSKYEVK